LFDKNFLPNIHFEPEFKNILDIYAKDNFLKRTDRMVRENTFDNMIFTIKPEWSDVVI